MGQDVGGKTTLKLTLEDVVSLSQSQSLSSLTAKYSFISSYWQYRSYRAQFLPSLNLNAELGAYNRSQVALQNYEDGSTHYVLNDNMYNSVSLSINQNIPFTGGRIAVSSYLSRLDQFSPTRGATYNSNPAFLYLYQPIFQYNSLKWQKKTEPRKYERAKKEYLEDMESIALTATNYFFNLLTSQKNLEMARRRHENTQMLYGIAQERFKLGTYTKDELLQVELRVLNAELDISSCEIQLRQSMLQLKSFLGMSDDVELELLLPAHAAGLVVEGGDAVARSLQNTSFSLNQEINLIEAESAVAKARADRGFSATLTAQLGFTQAAPDLRNAYKDPLDQEIVGLSLSIPIVDWGLGKGRVMMAETQQEIVLSQIEQEIIAKKQEMIIQVVRFNAQSKQCDVSQRADEIASERYEMALQRFKNGTIGILDMNTAQSEKDDATANYLRELSNYWVYYYTLRKNTLYGYIYGEDLSAEFDKMVEYE